MKNSFGKIGEEKAAEFLKKLGYKILAQNFRALRGEIDIIALDKDQLVFVEVKSRTNSLFGSPLEAITQKKLNDLFRAADVFQKSHPNLPSDVRFDAVEVMKASSGEIEINHVKNITM